MIPVGGVHNPMIRSPGAEPRDQVKRKRALQGCNHRRGITWWGLIRADVGSAGESTRSRAASSLGCCFGCCLSPTSDEKTPACLENPLPCFPCATQAHPLVVALCSRGSRPEFADAFLRQITTSNRDDFLSKARAGTNLRRYIDAAWNDLKELGISPNGSRDHLRFTLDMKEAVAGADLVQENGPERKDFKIKLFADMDSAAPKDSLFE